MSSEWMGWGESEWEKNNNIRKRDVRGSVEKREGRFYSLYIF